MVDLTLPMLSISMEEGVVLAWLVEDGAEVSQGQAVVEIETDKATLEVESPASGILRIAAEVGARVPVDGLLARVLAPGEADVEAGEPAATSSTAPVAGPPRTALAASPRDGGLPGSPAARRRARELGVDLDGVAGSGPGGRVLFLDVEGAATEATTGKAGIRSLVVESIAASWRTIPHIHIAAELEAAGLAEAHRLLGERDGPRITVTDLLLLAVAGALREVPDLNGTVRPGVGADRSSHVHLGLAVATDDGVIAPVMRDASTLRVEEIAVERARLVGAARTGELEKRDLAGATCTVSNLGAYPVDFFAPVISGPQVALIAIGRLVEKPVAVGGAIAVGHRLWVNAAIDHRGADGEAGGRFLAALERHLAALPDHVREGGAAA
jgi:pyruvate dehydrogenase E2 component (dihydrolipoamide acetyltransferase)